MPNRIGVPAAWSDDLDRFAVYLDRLGRLPSTAAGYQRHVQRLAYAFPERDPAGITPTVLHDWLARQNWSRHTYSHVLVSLRLFYRMLIDQGRCVRSPVAGLPSKDLPPGPPPNTPRDEAWSIALRDYLTSLRAGGRTPRTINTRRWLLANLADLYPDPWTVSGDDLALWLAQPDISPEYRRSRRNALRGFYGWAVRTGRISADPTAGLLPIRTPRALPRPIPNAALLEALHAADDRQRLIMLLAALAGLRRAEIAGLRWEDWTPGQLMIRGKGGHMRRVPVHPDLAEALTAYRDAGANRPVDRLVGYVFSSSTHPGQPLTPAHLGVILRGILPAGYTLHTLRHRFATTAYASQRDLRAVQELLGHARPETTSRYAAVPDGALTAAVAGVGIIDPGTIGWS